MEDKEEILDYIKQNIENEDLEATDEYDDKLFNPYTAFLICNSFGSKDPEFLNTFTGAVYEYIKAAKAYEYCSDGLGKSMCDERGVKVEDLDTYQKNLNAIFDIGEKLGLEDEEDMGLFTEAISFRSKQQWKQLPALLQAIVERQVFDSVKKDLSRIK